LITGLGKLASGADVASLGVSGAAGGGDVEMVDAPAVAEVVPVAAPAANANANAGQGGKGKKKGGKGKR
jgi:hypothetical protein